MASKGKIKLKKNVKITFGIILAVIAIALVESIIQGRHVGNVRITIKNYENNAFLDSTEIKRLLTKNNTEKLSNFSYRDISIKGLESRVKANLFVRECEIARNLQGDLFVDVTLNRPIARYMREGKPDFYLDSLGNRMPTVQKYTAKVLLITSKKKNLPDFEGKNKNLLILLNKIDRDKFLKAQITQLDINQYSEITMYPQIGSQVIEFGKCINLKDKLKRLKIFYTKILRLKGWQAYNKLSLKYDHQIICE